MEDYPQPYIEHNLPLIFLTGLGERGPSSTIGHRSAPEASGTRVTTGSSPCTGNRAESLLDQFYQLDGSGLAWNQASLSGPPGAVKGHMRAVGRVGMALTSDRGIEALIK